MKLSKEQLRKIIKEELQTAIQENREEQLKTIPAKIIRLNKAIENAKRGIKNMEAGAVDDMDLDDIRASNPYQAKTEEVLNLEGKIERLEAELEKLKGQAVDEGYRDYGPEDKFTDSRTISGGGYSSHTGRLGDEQHDGSYEIPKWKVPSNLSDKQKKDFNIAMDIIQNTYDKYGGGPAVFKALNNAVKYGLDSDAAQIAARAYGEQMKESKKTKLTKEQLVKIITEELAEVDIAPGDQTIQGLEPQHDEENRVDRMRQRAIELIKEMSPLELQDLLKQINPET